MSATTAVVYTRVSTDRQEHEGTSLDAQVHDCRLYVRRQGWVLGREYQDVLSGRRADRPQYQAMLTNIRELRAVGTAVVIVVAALDRLGRNLLEQLRTREELTGLGVAVHFVRQGGALSNLNANILGSVAQDEAERTSGRVREVRRYTAERGFRAVGRAPWGYGWRTATEDERRLGAPRKVLRLDEAMVPFVREAFDRAADGRTIRQVAAWIAGLPSDARGGRSLGYGNVRSLLKAPVYVARADGPSDVPVLERPAGNWPALVDDDTWQRVQDAIASHRFVPRRAKRTYLLTGLIRCPNDGLRMQGHRQHSSTLYSCSIPGQGCTWSASVGTLDALIQEAIERLLTPLTTHPGLRAPLRTAWARLSAPERGDGDQKRTRSLEQLIEKARKRLDAAMDLLLDGVIDKPAYDRVVERHRADIDAAQIQLADLRAVQAPPPLPSLDAVLREAGSWRSVLEEADIPAKRDVLAALVERVVPERVGRGKYEARITWTPLGEALARLRAELAA